MKHFSTMLLALGLAAFSAAGQNVTVIMKDGTSHKFNADYLSELSFKDVQQGPETVEFKSILVEPYSNGNVTLTFENADGSVQCVTDLYGRPESTWLKTGIYTVSDTNDPYTMDPGYSSVSIGGEKKNITAGSVDVTLDGHIFSFAIDLTLEDGSGFKGSYSGELDNYTQWLVATLSQASYNDNPQPAGDFYVKFNDADWRYEMAVVFTGESTDTELQPGVYTYSDIRRPGTISPASYVDMYRPNANLRLESGSSVTVEKEGENYTIKMDLIFNDGRTGDFTYTGKISGTPAFEVPETVFDVLDVNPYGSGNTGLTFNISSDSNIALALDCYGSYTTDYFETGEYVVGASGGLYIDTNISYTFLAEDGVPTALTAGKMNVSRDGEVYTFQMDFTLADGRRLVATYQGKLNKFSPITRYTVTKASYLDNARPTGNFYVKFNDDSYDCTVALDLYADASAQTLPAGTYVFSTDHTPGTIGQTSYIETRSTAYVKEGSQVKVEVEGDVYTIEMSLIKETGSESIVSFSGQISGTPVFE